VQTRKIRPQRLLLAACLTAGAAVNAQEPAAESVQPAEPTGPAAGGARFELAISLYAEVSLSFSVEGTGERLDVTT